MKNEHGTEGQLSEIAHGLLCDPRRYLAFRVGDDGHCVVVASDRPDGGFTVTHGRVGGIAVRSNIRTGEDLAKDGNGSKGLKQGYLLNDE